VMPAATGPGVTVREATTADQARIAARDARTFGAPRPQDVERLLRAGRGVIAERGKSTVGFALGGFGRLGPAVADEPALALALLATLVPTLANDPALRGDALRVMVLATDRALVDGLRAMGFRVARTCLYMIRGGGTAPPPGYVLMGAHYA
jgi:hypothetical protein